MTSGKVRVVGHANHWVICQPPDGCGWYWQRRTVKAHWWSRPRQQYKGAFWEDREGRAELSNRPGESDRAWVDQDTWADWYSDCVSHLREVQALTALLLSKRAN